MEWMFFRKCELRKFFPPRAVRLIVNRPPAFILHDIALCIELFLRHCGKQRAHSVRFEPECQRKLIRRNSLEVVGSFEPGGSIECSTLTLNELEMFIRP